MTHDRIATFWLIMLLHSLRASWRNRHRYTGRARHRTSYLGSGRAVSATDLIWALRRERDLVRP